MHTALSYRTSQAVVRRRPVCVRVPRSSVAPWEAQSPGSIHFFDVSLTLPLFTS